MLMSINTDRSEWPKRFGSFSCLNLLSNQRARLIRTELTERAEE